MAKASKTGELNWHKGQLRWYKKIKVEVLDEDQQVTGYKWQPKYFGPKCKSIKERIGKKAALDAYAVWKKQQNTKDKIASVIELTRAVEAGLIPITDLGDTPYELQFIRRLKRDGVLDAKGYINEDIIMPDENLTAARRNLLARVDARRPKAKQGSKRARAIADHIDTWIEAQTTRRDAGQLAAKACSTLIYGINTFRDFANGAVFGSIEQVEQLLNSYRTMLVKKLTNKEYTAHTVNDKLKFAKQFIEWAWEQRILKEPPRQLDSFSKRLHIDKEGKPIAVHEITKLWDAAGYKMKAYMALALNCGFKNGDIAALTGEMLQGDRLVGHRQKTIKHKVPMNYKLWPLTLKLIKDNRKGTKLKELVFPNSTGGQITSGSMSALFKKVAKKAGVKATFEQLRDTSAELVREALLKGSGELALLQVFLAHKDSSTAQYYYKDDPRLLKSPKLDKIVMSLEKTYGLMLDTSSAKVPKKKTRTKQKAMTPKPPKTPSHPELAHLRPK